MTGLEKFISEGSSMTVFKDGQMVVESMPVHHTAYDEPNKRVIFGEALYFPATGSIHEIQYDDLTENEAHFVELRRDGEKVAWVEKIVPKEFPRQWKTFQFSFKISRDRSIAVLDEYR